VTDPSRILIFDLDGTLADSMGPATELFVRMLLEDCGIPDAISRPVYTRLMGKARRRSSPLSCDTSKPGTKPSSRT
jgi:beta-phosphoglucomutase-like phosphatase (HAD superfamily)